MRTLSRELCWSGIACLFLVVTPNLSVVTGSSEFADWSEPVNLGPPVNSAFEELDSFLSIDGRSLYFASLRPGGFGAIGHLGRAAHERHGSLGCAAEPRPDDQFSIQRRSAGPVGRWPVVVLQTAIVPVGSGGRICSSRDGVITTTSGGEEPVNLGEVVNSAANDTGALWFTEPAGSLRTLFFASDRPGGMGGDDLYASTAPAGWNVGSARASRRAQFPIRRQKSHDSPPRRSRVSARIRLSGRSAGWTCGRRRV